MSGIDQAAIGRPLLSLEYCDNGVGFYPLSDGLDAFVARLAAIDAAQTRVDAQYYLFHDDMVGRLFAARLMQAADRGVQVRLLLDDMAALGKDDALKMLSAHSNIQVKVFNPLAERGAWRVLHFLSDFRRVNRRMHNKSLIVDSQLALVGGRNIGNEYYGADIVNFHDLDVMVTACLARQVADAFEWYWRSDHAYAIEDLAPDTEVTEQELSHAREQLLQAEKTIDAKHYIHRLYRTPLMAMLKAGEVPWFLGEAQLFVDSPDKVQVEDGGEQLPAQLRSNIDQAKREVIFISPYFVPGRKGVKWLLALRRRGIEVSVFTNSLASTDVAVVHAGYSRYRKKLLRGGIRLFEMKPHVGCDRRRRFGSRAASLHTKAYIVDRRWVFVGSPNLDLRSMELNTEIGILFDSQALGDFLVSHIEQDGGGMVWELKLEKGKLAWYETDGDFARRGQVDPESNAIGRFLLHLLSLMPIEKQL